MTILNDRILKNDGTSVVESTQVPFLFLQSIQPEQIEVTEIDFDVEQFNLFSGKQIKEFSENIKPFNYDWKIPSKYNTLDVFEYIIQKFSVIQNDYNQDEAFERITFEYDTFKKYSLIDTLRCIIYIIETFKEQNIIWGVGRGSSCASFILFIIGLHMVDPIKYDINFNEFMHLDEKE